MADPNAMLNKFNPDALVRRLVDKYDLATWTTELCFHPMGYFEIHSLGAITHHGGRVVGRTRLRAVYQVYDQIYRSTQREFELDRMSTGIDIETKEKIRLHDKGFWGVVSLPEYRNRFREYREHTSGLSRNDALDARRYGYAATYDGCLCFNVMSREELYPGDFAAGFGYPLFKNPDPDKSALDATFPRGPLSSYRRSPGVFRSARSAVRGRRLRMVEPELDTPMTFSRVEGGASAPGRFARGSDAFPMGVYADFLRRRALAYRARTAVTLGEVGSVEFWVKPRWRSSIGKDSWWYWEDEDGEGIRIFREGTTVVVQFSLGIQSGGRLRYDASLWKAGTWHRIYVDWGDTGRLFVDGEEATQGGFKVEGVEPEEPHTEEHPVARHMDFGSWPPRTAEKMRTYNEFPDKYRSAIEWVEENVEPMEKRYTNSGAHHMWVGFGKGEERGGTFANATIDNVVVRPWRVRDRDAVTEPIGMQPFRHYPRTYHDYSKYYWQDISAELRQYDVDIELGSQALTYWHGNQSFVRLYFQIDDYDPQESPGG